MDKDQMKEVIRKRLALTDSEFKAIEDTPKFQRLFENALEAAKYTLVAEVVGSAGCHTGHVRGQRLVFDSTGNLQTRQCPDRVCVFLMPISRCSSTPSLRTS